MRTRVVHRRCDCDRPASFETKLNDALDAMVKEGKLIHGIEYSTCSKYDSTDIFHSAVILYDEVPTRTVIMEKIETKME